MPTRRVRRPARRARSPRAAPKRSGRPISSSGRALAEPPHGHIVCRGCGRIHPLELTSTDIEILTDLTGRGPSGWNVERVAYSLAAVCPKCQRPATLS